MFDPYHKWLGIPRDRQPPTHYEVLGILPEERDPEVIEEAAIRQSAHVRTYQLGPHARECTQLLNAIAQARAALLNPAKRGEYDARLRREGKLQEKSSVQVRTTAPPPRVTGFDEKKAAPRQKGRKKPAPRIRKQGVFLSKGMLYGIAGGSVGVSLIVILVIALTRGGSRSDPAAAAGLKDKKAGAVGLVVKKDLPKMALEPIVRPAPMVPAIEDAVGLEPPMVGDGRDEADRKVAPPAPVKAGLAPRKPPVVGDAADPEKLPKVKMFSVNGDPEKFAGKTVLIEDAVLRAPMIRRGDKFELQAGNRKGAKPNDLTFSLSKKLANSLAELGPLPPNLPVRLTCTILNIAGRWHARVGRIEFIGVGGEVEKVFAE